MDTTSSEKKSSGNGGNISAHKKLTPEDIAKKNKKNNLNRYKKPLETNTEITQTCDCIICTNKDKHSEIAGYSKVQELFLIVYSILKKRSKNNNNKPQQKSSSYGQQQQQEDPKINYICNNDYKPFVQNHPVLNNKLHYKLATQIFCSSPYFTNSQRDGLTKFGHWFGLPSPVDTINPWLPLDQQKKHSYMNKKEEKKIETKKIKQLIKEKRLNKTKTDENKPTTTTIETTTITTPVTGESTSTTTTTSTSKKRKVESSSDSSSSDSSSDSSDSSDSSEPESSEDERKKKKSRK